MDLETRALAATIGKIISDVRGVIERVQPTRFEIGVGIPQPGAYTHVLGLTEPLDRTSAALVADELNQAYWFDPRHVHRPAPRGGEEEARAVYLAWDGRSYPGRHAK